MAETVESLTLPGSRFLPKWAKICINYIVAISRDSSFEAHGPYHILHRRFRSFGPLMFKRRKVEAEFSDLNSRRMPFQVVLGTLFLTLFFAVHFVTLHNSLLDMAGLVVGEFVVSVLMVFILVIICFSYCFRRILELAITIVIGLV